MSLRRFCGWEPARWTENVLDEHGHVVRSVTRTEVEWDDQQRLWMLALAHYEASLCRKCGHDLHRTTGAEHDWVSGDPIECQACSALARAERAFEKRAGDDANRIPAEALIYTVRPVPRRQLKRRKPRG